jgi:DNA-binding transcriptional regulator LsrR (DeoR family)
MLAIARERGLVRISVPEYESRNGKLEAALKKKFGVEAVIVRAIPGLEARPLRQLVGYFASRAVREWFHSEGLLLLAGGRTMQSLIEQMQPVPRVHGLKVAQGMGHIDSTPGPYDAAELCRFMARTWVGSVVSLNAPLLFPDRASCQQFVRLPQIQTALKQAATAGIAIVGIGTLEESVLIERKIYTRAEVAELTKAGAVGEMLGRFYTERGLECRTGLRDRTLSVDLQELRKIPRRAGIAVGAEKSRAVMAAVRGGLLNTVITEESCAASMLDVAP